MKEGFSLKKKILNYLIIIILITTFLTENVIADGSKIDFSISIKSPQRIDDLTMNCTLEINKDRDTDVTYDISVRSGEKIEFIEFYLTPSFDNPILINKRIIYGDNKRIEEFVKTNKIYFQINTDSLNKIISEGYEIHFFIKFSVKTENIADLNSASSNNIIFGYNYITGESILPSRVRVDIWLPEGYIIDSTLVEGWTDGHNRSDNRLWYFKEVYWKDKEGKLPYEFYFRFHQLPKNVEKGVNELKPELEASVNEIKDLEGKLEETNKENERIRQKEKYLGIISIIYVFVTTAITFLYGNKAQKNKWKFVGIILLITLIYILIFYYCMT